LPLSSNPLTAISLGTRQRAALGQSEETDAAVIIVSEQTGAISVAHRGVLYPRLDEGQLRSELSRSFRIRPQDEPVPAPPTDATSRTAG
ncbi:MAG: diadenylate cyclase, partial [bacterium]